jgi:hypothetical protein
MSKRTEATQKPVELGSVVERLAAKPQLVQEVARILDLMEADTWVSAIVSTLATYNTVRDISLAPEMVQAAVDEARSQFAMTLERTLDLAAKYPQLFADPAKARELFPDPDKVAPHACDSAG